MDTLLQFLVSITLVSILYIVLYPMCADAVVETIIFIRRVRQWIQKIRDERF